MRSYSWMILFGVLFRMFWFSGRRGCSRTPDLPTPGLPLRGDSSRQGRITSTLLIHAEVCERLEFTKDVGMAICAERPKVSQTAEYIRACNPRPRDLEDTGRTIRERHHSSEVPNGTSKSWGGDGRYRIRRYYRVDDLYIRKRQSTSYDRRGLKSTSVLFGVRRPLPQPAQFRISA